MNHLAYSAALERLHLLISRKATGSPEKLTAKFEVSLGTINNMIKTLRLKGLPILYDRERETYYYEYEMEIIIFSVKPK